MSVGVTRPRIALSSCLAHADPERRIFKGKALQYTEQKLADAVWRGGALPVPLLDLRDRAALVAALEHVDGLILQGGADVAPHNYGEQPLAPEWQGDPVRDAFELAAVAVALELGKPVLGICRGHQVLNVALGGSLFQDISHQVEGSLVHRDWERYEILEHGVELERGSWLEQVFGAGPLLTNTVHHQAIHRVAPGLSVTARAPDGIIEGVERIDDRAWVVGIQWHPEWMDGSDAGGAHRTPGDPVFERFVEVCRRR